MTLAGWFFLSNHCAFGRMAQANRAKMEHACCLSGDAHQHHEPADSQRTTECCKALHAITAGEAKAPLTPPALIFVAALAATFIEPEKAVAKEVLALDSGPPREAASFSELVLQRSLRSHAPPLVA